MHFVENVEYTDKFNIPIFHKNFKENVRSKEREQAQVIKIFFFLEYSCFTVLYWFLLYNNISQPQVYTHPLS